VRGTFKTHHYGIQFIYCQTLNRGWPLFSNKRFVGPDRSGRLRRYPTSRFAPC
jgi:hypothetical protein